MFNLFRNFFGRRPQKFLRMESHLGTIGMIKVIREANGQFLINRLVRVKSVSNLWRFKPAWVAKDDSEIIGVVIL